MSRVAGVVLLLFVPFVLLALYACLHTSMHRSGDEGFYFSGMLAPIGLTALWLFWFGVALVRKAPPGPMMKVPGVIALLAFVSGLLMNIWRMGGYAQDRPLALLYLAPALAIGCAGIGNMRDDGKSTSARVFYVLAPVVFVGWIGLALALRVSAR